MEEAHRQMNYTSALLSMNHTKAILSIVKQFNDEEEYWDVQVQVDTKLFNCQRSILAANSEYFDTVFRSGGFRNSNVTANRIITLPREDATAFEDILQFMYTGDIIVKDSNNALSLLVLSDFLRLRTDHFKERMVEFVRDRCEESQPISCALDLLRYACEKRENVLIDNMSAHVCQHLYHFSEHPHLMQFSFQDLNELLKRSKVHIAPLRGSADVLVKIVHNWVNHNRKKRSQYRCKLMENVDYANVSSDFAQSLMNRLENAIDEVLNHPGKVRSLSQLETLRAPLEVGLGKTALWATISLNVPDVSKMPQKSSVMLFSSPCMISNLLWRITFERGTISDQPSDDVGVFLYCDGTNLAPKWNIYATAIFVMKSHKEGVEDFSHAITFTLFSSSEPSRCGGLNSFLPWRDLIDPEKGYIADDDSVTLKALVHADVPFLSYNPE